jgi:hypothetical protein
MDGAAFMGVVKRQCDGTYQDSHDFARERSAFTDDCIDAPAVDEFHSKVLDTFGLTDVEEGDNVRMLECSDDFAFTTESCRKFRVTCELWGKDFECNGTTEDGVGGTIHAGHAAPADFGMDFVPFESPPY